MTLQNLCDFTFSLCLEGPDFKCVIGPAHFIHCFSTKNTGGERGLTITFLYRLQHRAITHFVIFLCAHAGAGQRLMMVSSSVTLHSTFWVSPWPRAHPPSKSNWSRIPVSPLRIPGSKSKSSGLHRKSSTGRAFFSLPHTLPFQNNKSNGFVCVYKLIRSGGA